MTMDERDAKQSVVTMFLVVVIAVLVIFACSALMGLRAEVAALKDVLATKSDLVAIRTAGMDLSFEQRKCTTCHTERRFAGEHDTENGIIKVIKGLQKHPDVGLTRQDMDKVHASVKLLRCANCHSSDEIGKLALLSEPEQSEVIRRMQKMPGSGISPDEVDDIKRSFQLLVGF